MLNGDTEIMRAFADLVTNPDTKNELLELILTDYDTCLHQIEGADERTGAGTTTGPTGKPKTPQGRSGDPARDSIAVATNLETTAGKVIPKKAIASCSGSSCW